jgi:hypothetical protein
LMGNPHLHDERRGRLDMSEDLKGSSLLLVPNGLMRTLHLHVGRGATKAQPSLGPQIRLEALANEEAANEDRTAYTLRARP